MGFAETAVEPTPYDALLALPDNQVGELIGGELHTQPRPTGPHGLAEINLGLELAAPFAKGRGGPGGWWILIEPEVHLVRNITVVVPDLAGWRRARMPHIPEDHRFETVPDWICEILSPGTMQKDRALKLPLYARYGVAHAWLVDPQARTLEAYALGDGVWRLLDTLQDGDSVRLPPFDAVAFALADLWA